LKNLARLTAITPKLRQIMGILKLSSSLSKKRKRIVTKMKAMEEFFAFLT
jgi:hypothetical protein